MKVISFCLWGKEPRYTIGAIKNAELAKKYYPDFSCWFYVHEPSVPPDIVKTLQKMDNTRVILRNDETIKPNYFMSWRFEPHDDPEVELFMSRDTDTRILKREVLAVREWLETDKLLHIMRDSPCHYPVILGGMFGLREVENLCMLQEISTYFSSHNTDDDQMFLKQVVYPLVKHSCLVHDEIKLYENDCRPFPIKWDSEYHFVGEYRYEDESQNDFYTNIQKEFLEKFLPHRIENSLKIKYCVVAADLNKEYLDFYPLIRKCWKDFVGIQTKLILISKYIPSYLEQYSDEIILFPPTKNIHPAFQAQCIRILYSALFQEDVGVITSDMDLVPTQNSFYTDIQAGKDDFVVYRDCISEYKQYPICFCVATPKTWKSIFGIQSTNDIRKKLEEWYTSDYMVSSPYSDGWAKDQKKLYEFLNNWKSRPILLRDEQTGFKRLDRLDLAQIEANPKLYHELVKKGVYTDFHLPRPYKNHEKLIQKILYGEQILFDHVYIIHYTKLVERRLNLSKQLDEQLSDCKITWVDNFDRDKLDIDFLRKSYRHDYRIMVRAMTQGETANGLAHNHVITTISNQHDVCLVLEDDIVLKPNFLANVKKCLEIVPKDWEILTLGGHFDDPIISNSTEPVKPEELRIVKISKVCTTVSCYLLKKEVAKRIAQHPLFYPFSAPIDETLCHILPDIGAKIYWVQPWLAYEGTKSGLYPTSFDQRNFKQIF